MKGKKGFTLVELIVVIAIIGILAAVLIPSVSGYINKAHRGRDVELAGHMTEQISLYATDNNLNMSELSGTDIRTILLFNDYDLVPRKNNWVFLFDRNTNQIVVSDIDKDGNMLLSSTNSINENPNDPTHFFENYYLISRGNNKLEKMVDLLLNLKSESDYTDALSIIRENTALSGYISFVEKFNPATTFYFGNAEYYTNAENFDDITRIVVLELTSHITKEVDNAIDKLPLELINKVLSNTVRTNDLGVKNKILFKNVKDIDLTKVKKIKLEAFGTNNATDGGIYKAELGPYFKESHRQSVVDQIISITRQSAESNNIIIKRKVTVSYFNKDGLYAQGSLIYAVLQDFKNE